MYHVSAQGVDERLINVHYHYYGLWYVAWFVCLISLGLSGLAWFGFVIVMPTFLQALDTKTTQLNPKQISGLAFHLIFRPFFNHLTVV